MSRTASSKNKAASTSRWARAHPEAIRRMREYVGVTTAKCEGCGSRITPEDCFHAPHCTPVFLTACNARCFALAMGRRRERRADLG